MPNTSQPIFHTDPREPFWRLPRAAGPWPAVILTWTQCMQLRLKTGRRSQVWLPSFSRSDAALGLTEMESCLKVARAVRSGFLGWGQAFPPPQPKPSWLSGQSGEPDLIFLDLLLGISNTLGNPVSFRSGYLRVISFGKQPQLWERVQFTSQRTESQEADFTFRILREGPIEFIPFCLPDPLYHRFFSFDCFSCFRS